MIFVNVDIVLSHNSMIMFDNVLKTKS